MNCGGRRREAINGERGVAKILAAPPGTGRRRTAIGLVGTHHQQRGTAKPRGGQGGDLAGANYLLAHSS